MTDLHESPTIYERVRASDYDGLNMRLLLRLDCGHRWDIDTDNSKAPAFMECPTCTESARLEAYYGLF